jgi:hypothetical protein
VSTFDFACEILPPTDNALHRSRYGRVIASKPYRVWLDTHATLLLLALRNQGFREPDTAHWWAVSLTLTLTPRHRSDATNYTKATLDLLGGAQTVGGKIVHMGGLFANDRRVRRCVIEWAAVEKTPRLVVSATTCAAPTGIEERNEP